MNKFINLKRPIVHFFLILFTIIAILTLFLLILYYFTPNNYIIIDYNSEKFALEKEIDYKILKNSFIKISHKDYLNYFIKFNEDMNIIIKNSLKSQSIIYTTEKMLNIKYKSDILIYNNNDDDINIKMFLYKNFESVENV